MTEGKVIKFVCVVIVSSRDRAEAVAAKYMLSSSLHTYIGLTLSGPGGAQRPGGCCCSFLIEMSQKFTK